MCDLRVGFQGGHDHVVRWNEKEDREQNEEKIGGKKRPSPAAFEACAAGTRVLGNRGGHPISLPRLRPPPHMKAAETARVRKMKNQAPAPGGRPPVREPSRDAQVGKE